MYHNLSWLVMRNLLARQYIENPEFPFDFKDIGSSGFFISTHVLYACVKTDQRDTESDSVLGSVNFV